MVFYRKYRPQKFKEIVGQGEITRTLLSQLESGKVGHGYLFWGQRGTGKTSTARILAKAVNCESYGKPEARNRKLARFASEARRETKFGEPCGKCDACVSIADGSNLDLVEIDAASNRGIDEIRDLREKVKLSPSSLRFKVYIIDEAHMLTNEAFNALLKTLEEPPAHAIFILATTEISKLPATIVSRLQKFNFKRASKEDVKTALVGIAKSENIKIDEESFGAIWSAADGSFRDAVSILDQVSASGKKITKELVEEISHVSGKNQIFTFLTNIAQKDLSKSVVFVENVAAGGLDVALLLRNTILALEKILFIKLGVMEPLSDIDEDEINQMEEIANFFERDQILDLVKLLVIAEGEMKQFSLPQIPLVLAICKYSGSENNQVESFNKVEDIKNLEKIDTGSQIVKKVEPVKEKVEKGAKSTKISKSLDIVEKNWGEFLNKVREKNAHVVALLRSTKPVEFDGENLTLEVFYRFHKEKLEEPKIIQMLDFILGDLVDAPVKFRFVLAQRESKPTVEVLKSDVIDVKVDDLEKIAQEIFSK